MSRKPPYHAGFHAFHAGKPIEANPHQEGAPFKPEEYPGPHKNWRDGWSFARREQEFTQNQTA